MTPEGQLAEADVDHLDMGHTDTVRFYLGSHMPADARRILDRAFGEEQ